MWHLPPSAVEVAVATAIGGSCWKHSAERRTVYVGGDVGAVSPVYEYSTLAGVH